MIFDPDGRRASRPMRPTRRRWTPRAALRPRPGRPGCLDALERYYTSATPGRTWSASGPGARIQRLRAQLDFPEVAARLPDDRGHTVPVAVAYGERGGRGRGSRSRATACAARAAAGRGGPAAAARAPALSGHAARHRWPAGQWPPGAPSRSSATCSVARPLPPAAGNRPGRTAGLAGGGGRESYGDGPGQRVP